LVGIGTSSVSAGILLVARGTPATVSSAAAVAADIEDPKTATCPGCVEKPLPLGKFVDAVNPIVRDRKRSHATAEIEMQLIMTEQLSSKDKNIVVTLLLMSTIITVLAIRSRVVGTTLILVSGRTAQKIKQKKDFSNFNFALVAVIPRGSEAGVSLEYS
jgi:hypothetical protein